nr:glycosyltransferase [uncultured Cohaesibacter sp.]
MSKAIDTGRDKEAKSLITRRTDDLFNQLVAYFVNLHNPSIFISSFAWTANSFDYIAPGITRFLDANDVQSERSKSFKKAQKLYGEDAITEQEVASYWEDPKEEAQILNKADVVLAISPSEAQVMTDMIGTHKVLNAGFALSEISPMEHVPNTKRILFVGNEYAPNNLAIQEFIDVVFPKILDSHPSAELRICGSVCNSLNVDAAHSNNVILCGFVENLNDEYASAAIVVNPVQFGSGCSIKTPEALGFGKAVVCTPYIRDSLPNLEDAGAVVVSTTDKMHTAISSLLSKPNERQALETRAAQYARNYLTNEVVLIDLLNIIETKVFY